MRCKNTEPIERRIVRTLPKRVILKKILPKKKYFYRKIGTPVKIRPFC